MFGSLQNWGCARSLSYEARTEEEIEAQSDREEQGGSGGRGGRDGPCGDGGKAGVRAGDDEEGPEVLRADGRGGEIDGISDEGEREAGEDEGRAFLEPVGPDAPENDRDGCVSREEGAGTVSENGGKGECNRRRTCYHVGRHGEELGDRGIEAEAILETRKVQIIFETGLRLPVDNGPVPSLLNKFGKRVRKVGMTYGKNKLMPYTELRPLV